MEGKWGEGVDSCSSAAALHTELPDLGLATVRWRPREGRELRQRVLSV